MSERTFKITMAVVVAAFLVVMTSLVRSGMQVRREFEAGCALRFRAATTPQAATGAGSVILRSSNKELTFASDGTFTASSGTVLIPAASATGTAGFRLTQDSARVLDRHPGCNVALRPPTPTEDRKP